MRAPNKSARPGWFMPAAYAAAALALLGVMLGVWRMEDHRPWREEVRRINQERGRRLEQKLLAAGFEAKIAAERGARLAQEPPRVVSLTPRAFDRIERCLTCHQGIEAIGKSHPVEAVGCVVCHGGQGEGLTKAQAHRGLLGRNPSRLATARRSCGGPAGGCHVDRANSHANVVYRVERTIMSTMTGVLTSLRVAWGAQAGFTARFATAGLDDPRRPHPPPPFTLERLLAVPGGPPPGQGFAGLADDHWRKFCARCHLRAEREAGRSAHGRGCAACHGERHPSGRYLGDDAAISQDEWGHAAYHRLQATPDEKACLACHNRSGRIGLSYRGGMEDEGGRVPWHGGRPARDLSGGRSLRRLLPDVHAGKGLSCIDCHSGREIMGDGRLYGRMRHQTELRCATCHGGREGPPSLGPVDDAARYEAAYGPLAGAAPQITRETRLVLSAKGRPLANLRTGTQGPVLWSRSQPGRNHPMPQVGDDPLHRMPAHKRLACQACHSRWTPQCYGCHDYRLNGAQLWDYASGAPTPGAWRETRDLYRFRQPPLALDSRGRVRPVVPGCQVVLTELGRDGAPLPGRALQTLHSGPAGNSIVSTPLAPHTTRKEVPACEHCHAAPRVLGLGGGSRLLGNPAPQPVSDLSALNWPADWDALVDRKLRPLQGNTHAGARPLNRAEVGRVLGFAACLPCHRRPGDPVVVDPGRAFARIAPGGDHHAKHQAQVEKALR